MKKLVLPMLIITVLAIGFWYYQKKTTPDIDPSVSSYKSSTLGVSFKYSNLLTVSGDNVSITLHHEVPFEHHDYCDFKGEITTTIPTLTDFNATIRVLPESLVEAMKSESPYIPEENYLNGTVVVSPGFIDIVDFGNLKGYSLFEGAEGCGHTIYYLKVNDQKTVIVTNDFITVFSGAIDIENMAKAEAVPGVINKEANEEMLKNLIMSMEVN